MNDLPAEYGNVDGLLKELKTKLRFAEDLVELAITKNVSNKGKFVKEASNLNLTDYKVPDEVRCHLSYI